MNDPSARTFTADFKRFFIRGLAVLLPSVLTLWIVVKAYQFIDSTIAEPINRSLRVGLVNAAKVWAPLREIDVFEPTPVEIVAERTARGLNEADVSRDASIIADLRARRIEAWWNSRWYMNLIGLVVAIVAVYVAGRLLGGFFGRRIYAKIENVITSVPVFKQVYPYVKQLVDFLFDGDRKVKFSRVVVVEYPRKGIWSIGFLTGDGMRAIGPPGQTVTVFIPSSPTPFTGYTITVPSREVRDLPITVDEALRFVVTGGVIVPAHQCDRLESTRTEPVVIAPPDEPDPTDSPDGPVAPAARPISREIR